MYKLKGGNVLENVDSKIKVGNINNKLDLQTTDGTFLVNGQEFNITGGGSGISEIFKVRSSNIQISGGEISVVLNNITFNKTYNNTPLILISPLNTMTTPENFYYEQRHITLTQITTTGFKYVISTNLTNFDFYFIIIPTDNLIIETI